MPFLLLAASYLLGATPTSYWVGRFVYGVDLRDEGSGNLGATNTFRVLGWKAALPVVVVDIAKGTIPVVLFPGLDGSDWPWWMILYGAAAVLGHVYSFWVGFRGGKGVATSAGVFLALAPLQVGLALIVFVAVVSVTRIVSLGSIAAAVSLVLSIGYYDHVGGREVEYFTYALAAFVIWAHRSNIGRLLRGEENRFGSSRKSDDAPAQDAGPALEASPGPEAVRDGDSQAETA
jgi:glycerol-3-phosphate acyltransferase PlsY